MVDEAVEATNGEHLKTSHVRLLERIKEFVQVEAETVADDLGRDLLRLAQQNDVNLVAFIAPFIGVKVSPSRQVTAQIGLTEEYGIQLALIEMEESDPGMRKRPLWLLVHSPGGSAPSSYMIACRLRETFSHIVSFVPHVAYSGGTLLALAANEVVMGDFSRLGPVDPQVPYSPGISSDYTYVSANSMEKALQALTEQLKTVPREEVSYPLQVLTEKLDPVLRQDWNSQLWAVASYLRELLEKAGYNQAETNKLVRSLVFTAFPHDYVVHKGRAQEYGVHGPATADKTLQLELMQEWLAKYMLRPESRHYIRFITPRMEEPSDVKVSG